MWADRQVLLPCGGFACFLIDIKNDTDLQMDFVVHEVTTWAGDEHHTPEDTEVYLTGTVKWDGCSHVWFGEEIEGKRDGYLHLCGTTFWDRHCDVMHAVYAMAERVIKDFEG